MIEKSTAAWYDRHIFLKGVEFMNYTDLVFDLYGTLVDIHTEENAAAWEKHFKLSECNTLEDLENYGNNFFNI